jgi:uncharacterized tellurite resistance protein B-like protein
MIGALRSLFAPEQPSSREGRDRQRRLAAAALLIETARADFSQDGVEETAMTAALRGALELDEDEVAELVKLANEEVDAATSLYQFTRLVNDYYSAEEKYLLIEHMWTVAYADGDLDKYEEHLIRQVADLIYVTHDDYIRAKLAVASG